MMDPKPLPKVDYSPLYTKLDEATEKHNKDAVAMITQVIRVIKARDNEVKAAVEYAMLKKKKVTSVTYDDFEKPTHEDMEVIEVRDFLEAFPRMTDIGGHNDDTGTK